ncbi:Hypp6806 [Branchiostoma lanceolatum]|uniref:Hypp6806 protein n=1 Tax=Branchiostoma lanceolatum TaxID=7740 RepID=A0A8J9YVM6_BRALA|nr:Hypp6806 [Branchiostoma lanceolatum]
MPRGRTQEVHLTRKPIMLVPAGTTTVPRRAARVDMTDEGHDIGSAGEVRIDSLQGRQLTAILQGKGVEDVPHRISQRKALLKRLLGGAEMEIEKKIARLEDNDKLKDHVSRQQSKQILKNDIIIDVPFSIITIAILETIPDRSSRAHNYSSTTNNNQLQ